MLSDKLLMNGDKYDEEAVAPLKGESEDHGRDYVSMEAPKRSSKKATIGAVIAVVAIGAIVAAVMLSRSSTSSSASSAASSSSSIMNGADYVNAGASIILGGTSAPSADSQSSQSSSSSTTTSSRQRYDDDKTAAAQQSEKNIANDNEYSGSYDSDYDGQQQSMGQQDQEYSGEYEYGVQQQQSSVEMGQEQKQRKEQGQQQQAVKVIGAQSSVQCRTEGNDLVVSGIDRHARCVMRQDTKEVGVLYDGEAIFPQASDAKQSVEFGIYLLYSETAGCSVEMERVACL